MVFGSNRIPVDSERNSDAAPEVPHVHSRAHPFRVLQVDCARNRGTTHRVDKGVRALVRLQHGSIQEQSHAALIPRDADAQPEVVQCELRSLHGQSRPSHQVFLGSKRACPGLPAVSRFSTRVKETHEDLTCIHRSSGVTHDSRGWSDLRLRRCGGEPQANRRSRPRRFLPTRPVGTALPPTYARVAIASWRRTILYAGPLTTRP